jgi:hypothetical protein
VLPRTRPTPEAGIHENKVGALLGDCRECFFTIFRFDQLVTCTTQEIAQDLPVVHLILDNKDTSAHE